MKERKSSALPKPKRVKKHSNTSLKLHQTKPSVSESDKKKIECKYCSSPCWKSGIESTGKQRYKCKSCIKSQQIDYTYNAYDKNLNQNIIALIKEGVGILGISRLLDISPTTLIKRIKQIASEIREPTLAYGKTYEVDKLRTYVKKKED